MKNSAVKNPWVEAEKLEVSYFGREAECPSGVCSALCACRRSADYAYAFPFADAFADLCAKDVVEFSECLVSLGFRTFVLSKKAHADVFDVLRALLVDAGWSVAGWQRLACLDDEKNADSAEGLLLVKN